MIWLLANRAVKGKCMQAIENSSSVLQMQKTHRASSLCPIHILIGGGRKTRRYLPHLGNPQFLVTALIPPLDTSVECRCHVGCTRFSCSSYSCKSWSKYVYIIGSNGESSICMDFSWCTYYHFVNRLLGRLLKLSCPVISAYEWLLQKLFLTVWAKRNARPKVLCQVSWWPLITSDFELLFCECVWFKTEYRQ